MHSSTPREDAHRESEYQGAINDRREALRRFTDEPVSAVGPFVSDDDSIKLFRQLLRQHFSS
jgi:hypothetical protein